LRAKTNTYIKTPVRGEEPVFVVTGRKEDVNAAKREILSAAEHFSQIRAQRKNSLVGGGIVGLNGANGQPLPGQCTIKVRVPYRVVGLVVGPKGATIKRIQQETSTYIITPSREKEPIFEVTGLPHSVKKARFEIEAHIANRTGVKGVSALSYHSSIDELDGSGSASSSGGSSLTSAMPFNLGYALKSSEPSSGNSPIELFQKMYIKPNMTTDSDGKWNMLQNNGSGSATDSSLTGVSSANQMHSTFGMLNKNSTDIDAFAPFKLTGKFALSCRPLPFCPLHRQTLIVRPLLVSGRGLLNNNNMNSFDNSSGGSSSSNSSVSGSSGPSRTSTLFSLVGQTASFLKANGSNIGNNLASLSLENASKMLLNSSAIASNGGNGTLSDLYDQLLNSSAGRPNHVSSSSSTNGSQPMHSTAQSSSASSTQLTRSNSPIANVNHHGNGSSSAINANAASYLSNSASSTNALSSPFASSLYDRDEGIGESPTFDSIAAANLATVVSSMIARNNGASNNGAVIGSSGNSSSYAWPELNVSNSSSSSPNSNGVSQQLSRA
jgi:RNA-binding protein MEX3